MKEEATSAVDGDLFAGFRSPKMFEIDSFKFAVSISDSTDGQTKSDEGGGYSNNSDLKLPGVAGWAGKGGKVMEDAFRKFMKSQQKATGQFKAFKSGKGAGLKYPVSVQPVLISRAIDKSSPVLLQYCIDTTLFDRVSVVKRKAAGTLLAGQPYLRLDLVDVLIKDVSWTNDEPVKEETKLISRAITIRYKPQLPDGSLGAAKIAFWSMVPQASIFNLVSALF